MEKFANHILSYQWWYLTLIILLTALFAFFAKDIKTDNSIEIWLEKSDPSLVFYKKFKKDFGNEEFLLIAINKDDLFTAEGIRLINKIASEVKKLNGIKDVMSLAATFKEKINTPYFKELIAQDSKYGHTGNRLGKTSTLEIFKQDILKDPLYVNNLISKNGKTTAIIAMVEGPSTVRGNDGQSEKRQNWSDYRKDLVRNVRDIISSSFTIPEQTVSGNDGGKSFFKFLKSKFSQSDTAQSLVSSGVYLAGPTVVNAELDRMSQSDMAMFVPVMFCAAFVMLIIIFRKVPGIILPMVAIGLSIIWIMGIFALCGNTMNMVSSIITPVIFVVALSTTIHIINHHYTDTFPSPAGTKLITNTMRNIGVPCLFNNLTTAIGFLSLLISDVAPVKITGAFTAAGIMLSFFISTVIIIIVFSIKSGAVFKHKELENINHLNPVKVHSESPVLQYQSRFFTNLLKGISLFVCKRTGFVLILSSILVAVSIYGICRLKVESDIIKSFPDDSEILVSNRQIEQHLTGLLPIEIVLHSKADNQTILNLATLENMETFQESLKNIDEVTFSLSIVDFIKKANSAINQGNPDYFKIPETDEKAEVCLNMASIYGSGIADRFHTPDNRVARISVRMKQVGSDRYGELMSNIEGYIDKDLSNNLNVKITGVVHLLIEMQDYLLSSQIKTFSLAFLIIFIVMIFLLRSIKLAIISVIPNIIPIVITFGVMGFAGIRLDSGTIMIASVAIGIAVDDTIHFLYRFKKEFSLASAEPPFSDLSMVRDTALKDNYIISIEQTITHLGKAMIFTSIVAFCGFMTLCFSNFKPIQYFGLLTAITMVSALVGDLIVLPCCLLIIKPKIRF